MSIEFRYIGLDEYHRVSRFLDEYWAKNHIYVRERPLSSTGRSPEKITGTMQPIVLPWRRMAARSWPFSAESHSHSIVSVKCQKACGS